MLKAITREVSSSINDCQLTHVERKPIDVDLARVQHHGYESMLVEAGCNLVRLAEEPAMPDSVFVEDAALVLDELAVITRPGAPSRQLETASIADALKDYRELSFIEAPAVLDGGDVLVLGREIFIGLSARSNRAAADQLAGLLAPAGYRVHGIRLGDCLHLKTAVTRVSADQLLFNPDWIDPDRFEGFAGIAVDPAEPFAANALRIGDKVIYANEHGRTRERLEAAGISVLGVDAGELARAEGGVTCCSLVFRAA